MPCPSQLLKLTMCYSLLKYWCPSSSSKAPLIHSPHCSWGTSTQTYKEHHRYPSMGSRVGQWRLERSGCKTCIPCVKEQYDLSILSRTLWFNYSKQDAGTFTCLLLQISWHSTGMMTTCMVQRRGSPALGPEAGGNPHHMEAGACSEGTANCASGHRQSMPT